MQIWFGSEDNKAKKQHYIKSKHQGSAVVCVGGIEILFFFFYNYYFMFVLKSSCSPDWVVQRVRFSPWPPVTSVHLIATYWPNRYKNTLVWKRKKIKNPLKQFLFHCEPKNYCFNINVRPICLVDPRLTSPNSDSKDSTLRSRPVVS